MRVDAFKASVGAFKEILFSRDCVCVKDAMAAALLSLSLFAFSSLSSSSSTRRSHASITVTKPCQDNGGLLLLLRETLNSFSALFICGTNVLIRNAGYTRYL